MKRVLSSSLAAAVILLACGTIAFAQADSQSLGDYARSVRKSKSAKPEPKKVYDNDNLPSQGVVSVVGNATDDSAADKDSAQAGDDKAASQDQGSSAKKKDEPQIKEGQPAAEREKAIDAWKEKLSAQKDTIAQLSHELDLLQREYRVKAAEFYADTARRTQNPTGFAKDDADYKKRIADKQQAVDAAKAKLSEMQDEARKDGAPSSVTD
jgi:chromosome segregation ATPase